MTSSDNGLSGDENEDDDIQMPSKEDVLQILLDLKGSRRSSIKVEHAENLRELFDIIQSYKKTAAPKTDDQDREDDDEDESKHDELWAQFEDKFDLDNDPFTSISTLELPLSPPSSSGLPSPSKPNVSFSNDEQPSASTSAISISNAAPSSQPSDTNPRPPAPSASRSAPLTNPIALATRVNLLPIPTSINPSTYCVPLSLISPPPTPPEEPTPSDEKFNPPTNARPAQIPLPLVSPYARSLYPIPVLPADGARKSALKAKKKSGSSSSGGRDGRGEIAGPPPADLFKWQATVNANPLSQLVRTAKKCLGSADWETAYTELRFNRAMERVETLKIEGRWSFRQPKKQKGPPIAKSHWDWVLEEMKWLQTDFREERRWKVALAYEMSQWVLDWHDAKDKSEVCVRVGTARFSATSSKNAVDADGDAGMDGEALEEDGFGAGVSEQRAEVEDNVEMDAKPERVEPVLTPLDGVGDPIASAITATNTANDTIVLDEEPVDNFSASIEAQAALEDALDDLESKMTDRARDESDDSLKLAESTKKALGADGDGDGDAAGEDEDEDADGEADADGDGEVDMLDIVPETVRNSKNPDIKGEVILGEIVPPEVPAEDAKPLDPLKTAANDPLPGLKDGSLNPTLVSSEEQSKEANEQLHAEERLRTARFTLLNLTSTSVTFDLAAFSLASAPKQEPFEDLIDDGLASSTFEPSSALDRHLFSDLFGDASTYSMAIPVSENAILQGRIDRRIDDATVAGGKLAHTSRLLEIRPVLVSTLQPGKKRKGDEWDDLGDLWGGNDSGDYGEPRGEVFGGTTLFARKKAKESIHPPTCSKPNQPRNYEIRLAATIWQSEDDIVLQRLCHQYPFNWQLISDAFNTSRRTLSIDRRSPWDCFQRWNKKWNPNPDKEAEKKDGPTSEPGMIDGGSEAGPSTPGGTATATTSSKKANKMIPAILDPKFEGSKKKLRHAKLYEAMRKTAKRRDITNRKPNLKEPRRVMTAHESHNQYTGRVGGPTPADLSQHKQDRDKAYAEAARANQEQRDIAFRRYQANQIAQQQQQGGPRPGGSGTPPGAPHSNQGNRPPQPPFQQNGGPPQHQQQGQPSLQHQQQHQQRLMQQGGGPPQAQTAAGVTQQLHLLQAHRNANQQGGRPQGQQMRQGGGPDRKSSPASMGSPSMQAAGISRPGSGSTSASAQMGMAMQNARGDTPQEIAQNLVEKVPAEIASKIKEPLVINGHQVTPQLIQAALNQKLRIEAAAKAAGGGGA